MDFPLKVESDSAGSRILVAGGRDGFCFQIDTEIFEVGLDQRDADGCLGVPG